VWFISEALLSYLSTRSLGKKAFDFLMVATLLTWVGFIYTVATNFEYVKQFWTPPKVNIKELVLLDKSVNDILNQVLVRSGSDRASIGRFHNTVSDLQGRHFVYESRSNEVVQPGVSQIALLRQNVLLSMINIWAQDFVKDQCSYMTDLKAGDVFFEYYRQSGVKSDVKCPIMNTHGDLVGFIDIEFTTRVLTQPEMKAKEAMVRDAASKIGAVLSVRAD
jgi:hypothetical protein